MKSLFSAGSPLFPMGWSVTMMSICGSQHAVLVVSVNGFLHGNTS